MDVAFEVPTVPCELLLLLLFTECFRQHSQCYRKHSASQEALSKIKRA